MIRAFGRNHGATLGFANSVADLNRLLATNPVPKTTGNFLIIIGIACLRLAEEAERDGRNFSSGNKALIEIERELAGDTDSAVDDSDGVFVLFRNPK